MNDGLKELLRILKDLSDEDFESLVSFAKSRINHRNLLNKVKE